MAKMNSKVQLRLKDGIKKYQKIFSEALAHDINESDTVSIIRDFLSDVLGYDKYKEITSEYSVRGTFCDLAVKTDGKIAFLIEVKAIGLSLKDAHLRQAEGYAANEGIDWVILTNGNSWNVYKMTFQKPIKSDLIIQFDIVNANMNDDRLFEQLFILSREGITKSAIEEYHAQFEAMNRYSIAAILLSQPVISTIRKELKKIHAGVRVDEQRIHEIIHDDILKRDITESEKLKEEISTCCKKINALNKQKAKCTKSDPVVPQATAPEVPQDEIQEQTQVNSEIQTDNQ
jgi:hypothetical protein